MPNSPVIQIGCVSNLYTRSMHFINSGDKELGHSHPFDHLTLLTKGSLRITIEGQVTEFKAPHMIFIVKNKNHELIALEDDTLAYCIHALRDGDTVGDILDPTMVPNGAFTMELYQSLNITPLTNDNNNN